MVVRAGCYEAVVKRFLEGSEKIPKGMIRFVAPPVMDDAETAAVLK